MRRPVLLAAAACFLALAPGLAPASAQETASWHRITNPDNSFTIEFPCDEAEMQDRITEGSVGRGCEVGEVWFGAVRTTNALGADAPEAGSTYFDDDLAGLRKDAKTGRVEEFDLAGTRAFRAWMVPAEPFALVQVSENKPDELIYLMVMADPEGPNDTVDRAATEQSAIRFFDSLQVAP